MNADPDSRVDLFLSFHGSERVRDTHNETTRDFMRSVYLSVVTRCRARQANPSIFFDEHCVAGKLSEDIFTAALQTRGGGLGICVLTPCFFDYPWCIAELAAMLHIQQQRFHHVKLRFICLDCQPADVIYHPHVRQFVDQMRGHSLLSLSTTTRLHDDTSPINKLADLIMRVWDGENGVGDAAITILGKTREQSMHYLQSYYLSPQSKFSLQIKEKAINSYYIKWQLSKTYSWNVSEIDYLTDMFHDIRLKLQQEYRERDRQRELEQLEEEEEDEEDEEGYDDKDDKHSDDYYQHRDAKRDYLVMGQNVDQNPNPNPTHLHSKSSCPPPHPSDNGRTNQ